MGQVFGGRLRDEHEGELRLPRNRRRPPETKHVAVEFLAQVAGGDADQRTKQSDGGLHLLVSSGIVTMHDQHDVAGILQQRHDQLGTEVARAIRA